MKAYVNYEMPSGETIFTLWQPKREERKKGQKSYLKIS